MKIKLVKSHYSPIALNVVDCKVDKGYRQGTGRQLTDVDIDFQSDRRQEIKDYLEDRYNVDGKQRVFSAGTFSSMKLKAVLKDVARVYRVPVSLMNYITAIFEDDNMGWTELFKLAATNKKVRSFILDNPEVIEDIRGLLGQPRSASVHASAIIVTPDYIDGESAECFDMLPIKKIDGILVSELDGYSIEEIGLLKNDCLGIKELTKLHSIISLCNDNYKTGISFEQIVRSDLDDDKTYRLISEGYSQSIFQFSSRGMTRFLMDMQPETIEDLIAANALFRPATLESGSAEKYLIHKRGEVAPVYLWGTFDALRDTYAQLVYQEQLARISREVGDFSLAEGVNLLKLISKKKTTEIHAMKNKFMDGVERKGCPKDDAVEIWAMIEAAGAYIFNKAHATAYAITSYTGAWLKANYPTAFYTVALQWCDDKEIASLMSEMEDCSNAKIVPPDINISGREFYTDYSTDKIFWSLSRIKMLGAKTVDYIIEERNKNGQFLSIENFIHRIFKYKLRMKQYWDDPEDDNATRKIPVNTLHVRHLILAGCFDNLEKIKSINERYHIRGNAYKICRIGFYPQF